MAAMRVKNKTPAPVQITAEQILREAQERQESEFRPPNYKITDTTELSDYRLKRRTEFENQIRNSKSNIQSYVMYAKWEESQNDHARARSIWERASEHHHRNHTLWLKYAEFEMRNKFVNSARNVFIRAVSILPRVDQIWYEYVHMEEKLGNINGAREIFERWMNEWSPDEQAWLSFIKFELRYNEIERARSIYKKFVLCHPKVSVYIRYAKFEMKFGEVENAREVYELATEVFKDDYEEAEMLFVAFAEFEERCKEVERARVVYKFGLDHIPKGRALDLYRKFVAFEKRNGVKEGIEDAIVGKRRFEYEDEVRKSPLNYDSWFDYLRLEESLKDKDKVREIYERAIANVPPVEEKRYWERYIYLWINYALFEEIETGDVERAQNVYIEMELQLGNIDRCRKLYQRYLEWCPENCYAWRKYAELEVSLAETERARAIFELAISQPSLDMPELLWKAYIDFEMLQGELQRTRALYERLLDRTKHYNVWISFAKFEASAAEQEEDEEKNVSEHKKDCIRRAREIFDRANSYYKDSTPELKEERAMLLEDWLNMEPSFGKLGDVSVVESKLPKKLKKRKPITREDGSTEYEEYIDYLFPEESQTTNLKLLEAAYKWKKQKVSACF